MESVIEAHERTAANVQLILDFASDERFGEFETFENGVISALIQWRTSELSTGALDALLASGELGELANPKLRASLAAWKSLASDAQEKEALARDFIEYVLTPSLSDETYIAPAYVARPPYGNTNELVHRSIEVRSSAKLRSLSAARLGHIRMAIHSQAITLQALQDILLLIDSELAE